MQQWDLLIVGAGPAGLMAAKTAVEKGLHVLVIEKYNDFHTLQRACSTQFILDDGYEGEWMEVKGDKLVFKRNQYNHFGRHIGFVPINPVLILPD